MLKIGTFIQKEGGGGGRKRRVKTVRKGKREKKRKRKKEHNKESKERKVIRWTQHSRLPVEPTLSKSVPRRVSTVASVALDRNFMLYKKKLSDKANLLSWVCKTYKNTAQLKNKAVR